MKNSAWASDLELSFTVGFYSVCLLLFMFCCYFFSNALPFLMMQSLGYLKTLGYLWDGQKVKDEVIYTTIDYESYYSNIRIFLYQTNQYKSKK